MPSPFPGMDPYMERGDLWPELHNRLMIYACDALQPVLPDNYVARLELRIYTEREGGSRRSPPRVPDLELVRMGAAAGTATASRGSGEEQANGEGYWIRFTPVERREVAIAIRSVPDDELVTAVELLSPANKRTGVGRDRYLTKQRDVLDAGLNLVEIDLLRGGLHTAAVPEADLENLPSHHYLLCVHRSSRPWGLWVRPWTVREPFPPVPVPLAPGDAELTLDLHPLFTAAYDNAAFRKLVDYGGPPDPPLDPKEAAWADTLLREAGLRGAAGA